jgi:hypothetical protein
MQKGEHNMRRQSHDLTKKGWKRKLEMMLFFPQEEANLLQTSKSFLLPCNNWLITL